MPNSLSKMTSERLGQSILRFVTSSSGRVWLKKHPLFEKHELISEVYLILEKDKRFLSTFESTSNNEACQRWTNWACHYAIKRIARRTSHRPFRLLEDVGMFRVDGAWKLGIRIEEIPAPEGSDLCLGEMDQSQILKRLANDQQEIIRLKLEGRNQSEIAIVLQISRKTVRRRLNAAAASLRPLLPTLLK